MDTSSQMQAYKKLLLEMSDLLQKDWDIALYLTDTEKCIEYLPGKTIDAKVRKGDVIRPDEPIYDVIHKRKNMDDVVPKEVFGFAFRGIGKPLLDDKGQVIGALAIARNIENEMQIAEASSTIFSALEQINASIQEMSSMTISLSNYLTGISELSDQTQSAIKEAGSIVRSIQDISTQSNLLALNAAIEAARAGQAGRSFSVVANEMKKLSSLSNDSASKVSDMLSEMKSSIENIAGEISKITASSQSQVEATSQISSAIEEVTKSSEKLVSLSQV